MEHVSTKCVEDLCCGVNMIKNAEHMTDLEKKHTPVITAPTQVNKDECFDVEIEVGKLLAHPNEPSHHIEFIELYAGHTYLGRMDFAGKMTCPKMKICVSLPYSQGNLRAFAHCNLHGTWESEQEIDVLE